MNWFKRSQNNVSFDKSIGYHNIKIDYATIIYEILPNGTVSLCSLRVPAKYRRQGYAKKALSSFVEWLDKEGLTSYLGASPLDKRTNNYGLEKLYSEFGFSPTGKRYNMIGDKEMVRHPQEDNLKQAQSVYNKELWQITESEFNKKYMGKWKPGIMTEEGEFITGHDHGDAYNKALDNGLKVKDNVGEVAGWRIGREIILDKDFPEGNPDYIHKAIVRKALIEGKPVPAEVLSSYPNIFKI